MNKPDKGEKNGSCNRSACQAPGAVYFNKATERYYCPRCAAAINYLGGQGDTLTIYGEPLLCRLEHPEPFTHELKTWPEVFRPVQDGRKPFEVRVNDRDFRVGDLLRLREYIPESGEYTGAELKRTVSFMLAEQRYGLPPGLVVLGLTYPSDGKPVAQPSEADDPRFLGPFETAARAFEETRRAVALLIKEDPDTWPAHGNAPGAICAVVAFRIADK